MVVKQFQDGGRPPFWKSLYRHISAKNIIRFLWNFYSSRFWTGWTSSDQKWKSCIGQTPSSTERISCCLGYLVVHCSCVWRWKVFWTRNELCRTRSLSNATVSFLITRGSFSSKFAAVYKISSKSDDFFSEIWRYNDYQNGGRPPSWNWFTTIRDHPQCLLLAAAAFQIHVNLIHRSEDIAIWIFCIFGLKCLFRPPKQGFWGTQTVTHPGTNRVWCSASTLIEANTLPLSQTATTVHVMCVQKSR